MSSQQSLLLLLRARTILTRGRPRPTHLISTTTTHPYPSRRRRRRRSKGPSKLARAALQQSRNAGHRDRRGLGHEVEVEELDELELYVAARAAGAEERGHGEQAVEALEGPRVPGRVDEGRHERQEGRRLDGRTEVGFDEV